MANHHYRDSAQRGETLTTSLATKLLKRHLNPLVNVTDIRKLYGGSTSRVLELVLDRDPGSVVAKINSSDLAGHYTNELESLRYFRANTHFPVPQPLACIESDPDLKGTMLIMQKVSGKTVESANLNVRGKKVFEKELAAAIAELHRHKAQRFGAATPDQTHDTWLDLFAPTVERTINETRTMLPNASRSVLDHVAQHLHLWLGHNPTPTLIHGDLWANNILINDARPDQPRILAFIDGQASFADAEYELAYLQLFGTAGRDFFDTYQEIHPIDAGYKHRSRVYWLITLLQHIQRYGERYVPHCEKIALELRKLAG